MTGRIARENTVRQPGRTAVTAAALMVGVALVTFASVFAGSAKSTFRDAVTNGSKAQAVIQNTDGFSSFTPQAAKTVAEVPGVKDVAAVRFGQAKIDGKKQGVTGIDQQTFPDLYRQGYIEGNDDTLRQLGPGTVIVGKKYAEDNGTKVGDDADVGDQPDARAEVEGHRDLLRQGRADRQPDGRQQRARAGLRVPQGRASCSSATTGASPTARSRRRSTRSSTIASPRPRRRPTRSSSTPRPRRSTRCCC